MTDPTTGWSPDVLGPGFEQVTLPLTDDAEGAVEATLVRYAPRPAPDHAAAQGGELPDRPVVLYVHGWSDYFFQRELAAFWHRRNASFFALDLSKYGRSLRPHQTPGYTSDLETYDEDIAAALEAVGRVGAAGPDEPGRRLVLMGHSTGGLILSLWSHRHRGAASALVLNSPWLELKAGSSYRRAITPLVRASSAARPYGHMPVFDRGFYARATSSAYEGTWDYDLRWRPPHGFEVHSGWFNAVLSGHEQVVAGLDVGCPVLVLLSTHDWLGFRYSEVMTHVDIALDVEIVARRAPRLGRSVTIVRVEDAVHDVLLSTPEVRGEAYAQIDRWASVYALRPDDSQGHPPLEEPVSEPGPRLAHPPGDEAVEQHS